MTLIMYILRSIGADQGFQVREAHLKKLCRAQGGAKIFGVFRVKNHDFTPINHIFSNFRVGTRARCALPHGSAPGTSIPKLINIGRRKRINLKEVIDRFIWTIELCHI